MSELRQAELHVRVTPGCDLAVAQQASRIVLVSIYGIGSREL